MGDIIKLLISHALVGEYIYFKSFWMWHTASLSTVVFLFFFLNTILHHQHLNTSSRYNCFTLGHGGIPAQLAITLQSNVLKCNEAGSFISAVLHITAVGFGNSDVALV